MKTIKSLILLAFVSFVWAWNMPRIAKAEPLIRHRLGWLLMR